MKTPERILRDNQPTDGIDVVIAQFQPPPLQPLAAWRARGWPAAAGLVTALAIGLSALRLSATAAEASPLAQIVAAERNAPRCTLKLFDENGKVWLQAWQEGEKSAMLAGREGPRETYTSYDGKRMWVALASIRVAIVQSEVTPFRAPLIQKIADYHGRVVRTSNGENGSKTIVIERAASTTSILQRDTIVADAQDRPISVTHEYFRKGRWTPGGTEARDYDMPIPDRAFSFQTRAGYEVYDVDANRGRIRDGLRNGATQKVKGMTVRLGGVLQDRSGAVTVVYSGGATPLPDAKALLTCNGKAYRGLAVVGHALDPRAGRPIGVGGLRFPGRLFPPAKGMLVEATPEPYGSLDGRDVRLLRFNLPKLMGNASRRIRLTLPIVREGKLRTVGNVRGTGVLVGTARFDIETIPSNGGEEIFRLPKVKRAAYEVPLAKAKG